MKEHFPADFGEKLLTWYDKNRRKLPWREEPSPYRTWISEVMLQQTRVEAGIAYFERFTRTLPDVAALAAVDEQALLKLWEGLGYYSRARNLKKAAAIIMEQYGGKIPADFEALKKLPGLGEYSAGAVASIAFGIRVPAVDGNVLRVTSRVLADDRNIEDTAVKKAMRALVAESLPETRVGDYNQALMELGALVCLPNGKPLCEECPVAALCESRRLGIEEQLPVRNKKPARKIEKKTVLVLYYEGKILLRQRPPKGLLASLWEFPSAKGLLPAGDAARLCGAAPDTVTALGPAKHIFTHKEWHMEGFFLAPAARGPLPAGYRWVLPQELWEDFPVPSAYSVYLARLREMFPEASAQKE